MANRLVIDDEKISSDSFLLYQLQTPECLPLDDKGTKSKLNVEVLSCNLSLQDESSSSMLTSSLSKDPFSTSSNNPMPHSLFLPPSMEGTELYFASPLVERYFFMHFYSGRVVGESVAH